MFVDSNMRDERFDDDDRRTGGGTRAGLGRSEAHRTPAKNPMTMLSGSLSSSLGGPPRFEWPAAEVYCRGFTQKYSTGTNARESTLTGSDASESHKFPR